MSGPVPPAPRVEHRSEPRSKMTTIAAHEPCASLDLKSELDELAEARGVVVPHRAGLGHGGLSVTAPSTQRHDQLLQTTTGQRRFHIRRGIQKTFPPVSCAKKERSVGPSIAKGFQNRIRVQNLNSAKNKLCSSWESGTRESNWSPSLLLM